MITKVLTIRGNTSGAIGYLLDEKSHDGSGVRNLGGVTYHNLQAKHSKSDPDNHDSTWLNTQYLELDNRRKYHKADRARAYHIIFSFSRDDFDLSNPQMQSQQALKLVDSFMKQNFGDNSVYLAASQVDNAGHYSHVHVVLSAVDKTGKVERGNKLLHHNLATSADKYMSEHFKSVTNRNFEPVTVDITDRHSNGEYWSNKHSTKPTQKDQIKTTINTVLGDSHVTDIDSFVSAMRKHNIDVQTREISRGKNKGKIGISYKINGAKRAFRASRLGSDFGFEHINNVFASNVAKVEADKATKADKRTNNIDDVPDLNINTDDLTNFIDNMKLPGLDKLNKELNDPNKFPLMPGPSLHKSHKQDEPAKIDEPEQPKASLLPSDEWFDFMHHIFYNVRHELESLRHKQRQKSLKEIEREQAAERNLDDFNEVLLDKKATDSLKQSTHTKSKSAENNGLSL